MAVENQDYEIVKLLLADKNINVNAYSKFKENEIVVNIWLFLNKILHCIFYKAALHAAIENNDVKMVQLLLSCDHIDVNRKYISYFFFLIKLVDTLIKFI